MSVQDADLVRRAQSGDKDAFGALVRRYQGLAYGLAYHRVGNFADAEDIAQDAFVKAFRCLDQLERPDRFAAWMKAITVNECATWHRRYQDATSLEAAEIMPSYVSLVEEKSRQHEQRAEILQAVDALPEKSRLVLTLHHLSGLSCQEIGDHLSMSANGVAQRLNRARKQLKQMLMAEIEEDYAMNRLPESFAEEVLERVTIHPVREGYFVTVGSEGDVRGLMMGVGESFVTLWMQIDDLDAIVLGTTPGRRAEKPKGRAFESTLQLLDALGAKILQVVLHLSDQRRCVASMQINQGNSEITMDMRPSDAMGLAVRTNAPVYAEEPVVRAGNVAEDDVPAPDEPMDTGAYKEEFAKQNQLEELRDKGIALGVSPETWIDTVRFHMDGSAGTLRLWLEAIPEKELVLDLHEYRLGADMIFEYAEKGLTTELMHGDVPFGKVTRTRFLFSMLGEDARMRVVPEDAQE